MLRNTQRTKAFQDGLREGFGIRRIFFAMRSTPLLYESRRDFNSLEEGVRRKGYHSGVKISQINQAENRFCTDLDQTSWKVIILVSNSSKMCAKNLAFRTTIVFAQLAHLYFFRLFVKVLCKAVEGIIQLAITFERLN